MNYFSQILQRYSTTAAAKPTARLSIRPPYSKEKDESSDEQSCLKATLESEEVIRTQSPTAQNDPACNEDVSVIDRERQNNPENIGMTCCICYKRSRGNIRVIILINLNKMDSRAESRDLGSLL